MDSLCTLFRVGNGPSSSHTMGPAYAAELYRFRHSDPAARFRVTLLGSLASTGRGHLTDKVLEQKLPGVEILWKPEITPKEHPNGMVFEILGPNDEPEDRQTFFSIGGGELAFLDPETGRPVRPSSGGPSDVYPDSTMSDILVRLETDGELFWDYILRYEGENIIPFLTSIWEDMQKAIRRGLETEGILPGGLHLARKASAYYVKGKLSRSPLRGTVSLFAYALAVSEENAAGGLVVTAPTCGSCGVLPAVLRMLKEQLRLSDRQIVSALGVAGLFGMVAKTNGSISGAEVGCQGEVGVACSMAAAAAAKLMGGTPRQIEYAAEIGLEHHLGLTCDPIDGLVQIPCIERNALAATKALASAQYALLSDGRHLVKFDDIIETMLRTGHDLAAGYRETSTGGLAAIRRL